MSANIFGQPSCLNQEQADALGEIGLDIDPVSPTDSCKNKNSCGKSINELFEEYSLYSTQKGLYKSWGDIEFPWEISSLTPNLLTSKTDDRWRISTYHAINAYFQGDRVLLIEDDGYRLCLYEAAEDILAISGPFDSTKWNKVCCVETTIPVGLPTIEELKERYEFYNIDYFLRDWGEFNSEWDAPLYETLVQECTAISSTLDELEKCITTRSKVSSDDRWEKAKLKKDFFYKIGDYVLVQGECEDNLCLYIAIKNIPATEENYAKHNKKFSEVVDGVKYWDKVYCVATGRNKCLEPQRTRDLPNYQLVQLGTEGHYVEQPIPYYDLKGRKLCEEFETLTDLVESPAPKVLTQEEIDALE